MELSSTGTDEILMESPFNEILIIRFKQAYHFLSLGIDELFLGNPQEDYVNFLLVFRDLLKQLVNQLSTHSMSFQIVDKIYQAESLGRIAADQLFIENDCSDKINYLGRLRDLLTETREFLENNSR